MADPVPDFLHEIIDGASGPCKAYSGMVAAIRTFNGHPLIIMAATRSALIQAIAEISPTTKVNAELFMPASIVHDRFVKRKEGDL